MKITVYHTPIILYLIIVLVWLSAKIEIFLVESQVPLTTLIGFRFLTAYSVLYLAISFCYWFIKNE